MGIFLNRNMPYRFVLNDADYSHFSSGRVFYSAAGQPAFPVRLASEVFQRCLNILRMDGKTGPLSIFDPCCGGAYHLAVLAFLHGPEIARIAASDADPAALQTARRNLDLLSSGGLLRRREEIQALLDQYDKDSHRQALASIDYLQQILDTGGNIPPETVCFQANALDRASLQKHIGDQQFNLLFTDVPYGLHSQWLLANDASHSDTPPLHRLLEAVIPFLAPGALAAIASDKGQKAMHERYSRVERFQIGKRKIEILRLLA